MENNFTIGLNGMQFYAYHGYYEEERKIGGWYEVDVTVVVQQQNTINDKLENTINYEQIYTIVEQAMQESALLIETVASKIKDAIKALGVQQIKVTVKKKNPPLSGNVGHAFCTIEDK
ncbi:MAG: dihydroneopterin aldolase [Chitinophagales bacterium]|nr:dihydroneopterin aldolase [Chitinophagales bacterium]